MQDPGTKIYIARKSDTACKHLAGSMQSQDWVSTSWVQSTRWDPMQPETCPCM